jgi:hypothetical protein
MPNFSSNQKKTSSDSKRNFKVIIGSKEHGLYISSTPSSAAKKAATKQCASNKSKKVEFSLREITQGSKKKTYGPYIGYIEKLREPIKLEGREINYKPIAKLKKGTQKGGIGISNRASNAYIKPKLYYELFNEIFEGKEPLFHTFIDRYDIRLDVRSYNNDVIMDMINWVLRNKPILDSENYKYYFILIYWAESIENILHFLINSIGIDMFIQIVFNPYSVKYILIF